MMSSRGARRRGVRRSARLHPPLSMEVISNSPDEGDIVDLTCDADDDIVYMEELPMTLHRQFNHDMFNFNEELLPSLRSHRRGVNETSIVTLGSSPRRRSPRILHNRRNTRREVSPTPYHIVDPDGFRFEFNWGDEEDIQQRYDMNQTIDIEDNDFIDITNSPVSPVIGVDHENEVTQEVALASTDHSLPQPSTSGVNDTVSSPEERPSIKCPVCFDSDRQIRRSGKQLMSTICGHLFCNYCIQEVVRSCHQCPTCRKKLTLKQIHPLFL